MKSKIYPPEILFILLTMSVFFHFIFPARQIVVFPLNLAGIVLILTGIFLNLWADRLFSAERTTVKPDQIPQRFIQRGPFKISRHPMYLGMFFILAGTAVILGSLVSFAFPAVFVIIIERFFISVEEKNMAAVFGKEYSDYRKRARKWI